MTGIEKAGPKLRKCMETWALTSDGWWRYEVIR